jgi:glycosyltransferase involved in cell wall biosynthesis
MPEQATTWPEPFGITMIEAMACGTPSIAFRRGAVLEIAADGITGFHCGFSRSGRSRSPESSSYGQNPNPRYFEERFSVTRTAEDYEAAYHQLHVRRKGGVARLAVRS